MLNEILCEKDCTTVAQARTLAHCGSQSLGKEKESRSVYGSGTPLGKDAFAIYINFRRFSRTADEISSGLNL